MKISKRCKKTFLSGVCFILLSLIIWRELSFILAGIGIILTGIGLIMLINKK